MPEEKVSEGLYSIPIVAMKARSMKFPTWKERYILFGYDYYDNGSGGSRSEAARFNTLQEYRLLTNAPRYEIYEVLDLLTGEWIEDFEKSFEITLETKID